MICLIPTLLLPAFTSHIKLFFLIPFLIIVFYQKPLLRSLWIAFLCGLILDLFSAHEPLPLHSLAMLGATCVIYPQRIHFFADTVSTLPLMTFFFSVTFTTFDFLILYIYGSQLSLSFRWILTDILALPAIDALFAFCAFQTLPLLLGKRQMKGQDYFTKESPR